MKLKLFLIAGLAWVLPACVLAGGADNAAGKATLHLPTKTAMKNRSSRLRVNTVYAGSLRGNIQRIARHYGWSQVVWNAPSDYNWVGTTRIRANGLPNVLGKLLADYPLQAQLYQGNHVLVIVARTL